MTRPLLLLLVCLVPFTACHTSAPPQTMPAEPLRLRVLTYNIHHGEGTDGKLDLERIAEVIKQANPDLVALQEVDRETQRTNRVDQAARLGELTEMPHYFAQAMPYQGGGYGNAMLSKTSDYLAYGETIPLKSPPDHEPRSVGIAEIDPWGEDEPIVVFATTHFSNETGATRYFQAKQLTKDIIFSPWRTAIFAGDFNFTPGSDPYNELIKTGWVDTAAAFGNPQPTSPAGNPRSRIDYIFVRPADRWRVIDVQVLDEPIASDHRPVLVELEYVVPAP